VRVEIVRKSEGLEELAGTVVVLDIFRASNTIIALLQSGVAELVLMADLEEARRLRARRPGWLLLGERKGVPPPDFDGGNSPTQALSGVFSGRRAIFTTSAGTQAVGRLRAAQAVFFGSFANAGALCETLKKLDPPAVHFLPMGFEATRPAFEDDSAAQYLADTLAGSRPDFAALKPKLINCEGAGRLRDLGQHADLDFCTTLDSHNIVPWVRLGYVPQVQPYPGP
jgi:2-phosphosulfolactate phosphatase